MGRRMARREPYRSGGHALQHLLPAAGAASGDANWRRFDTADATPDSREGSGDLPRRSGTSPDVRDRGSATAARPPLPPVDMAAGGDRPDMGSRLHVIGGE